MGMTREEAIRRIKNHIHILFKQEPFRTRHLQEALEMAINALKAQKHGRWMNIPDKPEWGQKMCSVCGDYFCCQANYCPNCGAKMDGERRDDDATDRR